MAQNGGDGYWMGYKNGTLMTLISALIFADQMIEILPT